MFYKNCISLNLAILFQIQYIKLLSIKYIVIFYFCGTKETNLYIK